MNNYFLYARKSTDVEDRQVLSIEAQLAELRALAKQERLEIAAEFVEKRTAKMPGRPVFNEMLGRIQQGEAQGIICWKLDRLARNPVDGGQISWLLQQGTIQHIQTHDRSHVSNDNVLMMSVEFGMANQFIRDLSSRPVICAQVFSCGQRTESLVSRPHTRGLSCRQRRTQALTFPLCSIFARSSASR